MRISVKSSLMRFVFLGTFLTTLDEVPTVVIEHMAAQLNVNVAVWPDYSKRSRRGHQGKIRQLYGFENFHASVQPFFLMRQIYARAWLTQENYLVLFDYWTFDKQFNINKFAK
jgi:hypothetical protein